MELANGNIRTLATLSSVASFQCCQFQCCQFPIGSHGVLAPPARPQMVRAGLRVAGCGPRHGILPGFRFSGVSGFRPGLSARGEAALVRIFAKTRPAAADAAARNTGAKTRKRRRGRAAGRKPGMPALAWRGGDPATRAQKKTRPGRAGRVRGRSPMQAEENGGETAACADSRRGGARRGPIPT